MHFVLFQLPTRMGAKTKKNKTITMELKSKMFCTLQKKWQKINIFCSNLEINWFGKITYFC